MSRGWTWTDKAEEYFDLDENELTDEERAKRETEMEERSAQLDVLAERWSQISHMREQRHFDEMARRECQEQGDWVDDFPREPRRVTREQDPEMWAEYDRELADYNRREAERKARRTLDMQLEDAQLQTIQTEMAKLGARMMRPYEHWNEDEAYMQMAENGYYDPEGLY